MTLSVKRLFLLLLVCTSMISMAQDLKLPRLFADHMVLQRNSPVRFWGWAASNETIAINIDGFTTKTKADEQGNWECLFPAHLAGGPFDVLLTGKSQIKIQDVYFGDVWVAGGQSNMEWVVGGQINNMAAEIADSNYPEIRFFKVSREMAVTPQNDLNSGDWKVANPQNVPDFSAVAWFFAKRNHLEKGVPVGVISSNWGGTPAEAWTSVDRLLGVEGYQSAAQELLDPTIDWDQKFKLNQENDQLKWARIQDQESFLTKQAHSLEYDDSNWNDLVLPNTAPVTDFVWVRKTIEIPTPKASKLSLGNLPQVANVFVNGKQVFKKTWSDHLTVLDISKDLLVKGKNVIAIRAINDWDNNVFIGEKGKLWLEVGKEKINLEGAWKFSNTVEPPMPVVVKYFWKPAFLFNAMIYPIAGYTIKGAIWYQGESNVDMAKYYKELFEAMIQDWRLYWKQGNFPFLYVQLANWQARQAEPSESNWAVVQEAQTKTLELPMTGMAVTIDIGDEKDIHPRNKQDVGKRLWLAARKVAYGETLVYSGPMYASHTVEDNKLTVTYDNIGSGLSIKGEALKGFALAGADGKYYWAKATINNNQVVLTSDQVPNPQSIRYAWADNPECNLYNAEGLPAVPFRTDQ